VILSSLSARTLSYLFTPKQIGEMAAEKERLALEAAGKGPLQRGDGDELKKS
jgi:hypothetical protein